VAPNGSDSAAGTMAAPFATLQKGHDVAAAGDTVWIRGGTYAIVTPRTSGAGITLTKSGTSDTSRIKYWAYPGEVPVFDFARMTISTTGYTSGFSVTGSWLHIKGLEIKNVPMNTRSNTGMGASGANNIFELLNLHHNNGTGLFLRDNGGNLILNCDSHDNYDPTSSQGAGENADGFGIHYQETGPTNIIRGCRAWWNSDDGYDYISQEVPVITENSWAMGNGYINSGTERGANGNGFKIGSSKTGIRHVVRNCLAWGNPASGFYANHSAGGNDWFNNTAYDNGTQFNMLASTWDADGNRTDGVTLTGDKVHRMRNNVGFPNDNTNMNGVENTFNTWNLNIVPANNDFVSLMDAGFMGPRQPDGSLPNLDFMKLRAGSQLIDKGTNVGLPFAGAAPDLGCYEAGLPSGGAGGGGGMSGGMGGSGAEAGRSGGDGGGNGGVAGTATAGSGMGGAATAGATNGGATSGGSSNGGVASGGAPSAGTTNTGASGGIASGGTSSGQAGSGANGASGASPGGNSGDDPTVDPSGTPGEPTGCGCRTAPRAPRAGGLLSLLLLAAFAVRRRRLGPFGRPLAHVGQGDRTGAVVPVALTERERETAFGIGRHGARVVRFAGLPEHERAVFGGAFPTSAPKDGAVGPAPDVFVVARTAEPQVAAHDAVGARRDEGVLLGRPDAGEQRAATRAVGGGRFESERLRTNHVLARRREEERTGRERLTAVVVHDDARLERGRAGEHRERSERPSRDACGRAESPENIRTHARS
jgi:MYXO-CTERM domain-containing protein